MKFMVNELLVTNLLEDSDKKNWDIYRIIPFERVVEIYTEKKLTLISPLKWQDPFEQYWLKALYPDAEIREDKTKSIFGLCFSKESRSDALWRIYSPNMLGVRIKLNVNKLVAQLNTNANIQANLFLGHVNYLSDLELIEVSNNIPLGNQASPNEVIKPWLNKRRAFKHESEVRLLCVSNDESHKQKDTVQFNIDPHMVITSINVDPRASPQLADALCSHLKQLTGMNGQRVRQSQLYQLPPALRTK